MARREVVRALSSRAESIRSLGPLQFRSACEAASSHAESRATPCPQRSSPPNPVPADSFPEASPLFSSSQRGNSHSEANLLRAELQPRKNFFSCSFASSEPSFSPAVRALLGASARSGTLDAKRGTFPTPVRSSPAFSAVALASAAAAVALSGCSTASAKQVPLKPIPEDVVLYQYEACPFCNKVKAFLDFHDIPYRVVEVNPLTRKEIKGFEYRKVPILVVDGEALKDSSVIITTLQERLNPEPANPPKGRPEQKEEEAKWRKWVDDHLVHLLSPNIYRNPTEALEAFDYIATSGNFGAIERTMARYVGATSMYFIGKKLKKKYNIDDERESLYAALREWTEALGSRKFLGGDKPNLADLAVFGVLRPIRQMTTGRDMVEHTDIGRWYKDMEAEVGASARQPEQGQGHNTKQSQ